MNAQRIIKTLANANAALKTPWRFSAEQLKAFRKTKRKFNKKLKALIDPKAPARPLPPDHATTLTLPI